MKRFLIVLAVAALVATISVMSLAYAATNLPGGFTGNNNQDTTFTFPSPVSSVIIINPDAECVVNCRINASANNHVVIVPGNSAITIPGWFDEVLVDKSTTQRVGVYGVQN